MSLSRTLSHLLNNSYSCLVPFGPFGPVPEEKQTAWPQKHQHIVTIKFCQQVPPAHTVVTRKFRQHRPQRVDKVFVGSTTPAPTLQRAHCHKHLAAAPAAAGSDTNTQESICHGHLAASPGRHHALAPAPKLQSAQRKHIGPNAKGSLLLAKSKASMSNSSVFGGRACRPGSMSSASFTPTFRSPHG